MPSTGNSGIVPGAYRPNQAPPNQPSQAAAVTHSHSLDAYIQAQSSHSHSLDVYIQAQIIPSHSLDAYIQILTPRSHSLDADVQAQSSISHFLDTDIQITSSKSHSLDVDVQITTSISHSLDAYIQTVKSHSLDAYIQALPSRTHYLDADILVVSSQSHFLDACLANIRQVSHTLDVFVQSVWLRDHSLDVWIFVPYYKSHSLDVYVIQLAGRPTVTQKDIVLPSLKTLFQGQSFMDENNCVSVNLTLSLTGGNFSISLIRDTAALPSEDTILTLPIGRLAVVKNVGRGMSTGGLVDTISGPILPYAATVRTFVAMLTDDTPIGSGADVMASVLAARFGLPVNWQAPDYPMRSFNFRGIALQGIQQLAGNFLYDVIVYKNQIYVVDTGKPVSGGVTWSVDPNDLISQTQTMEFSQDFPVYLNPMAINFEGIFMYDEAHAQKQPQTTVQAGSPLGTGGSDFIPIPDGWLVVGQYEEWTPVSGSTDLSNPSASVSRYWKQVPSPSTPGAQRGILSFTSLVKDLNLSKNLSTFVASPVTAGNQVGPNVFLVPGGDQSGLFGFAALETVVIDALSDQTITVQNAVILTPGSGPSGNADANFYSVPLEFWTFARVVPFTVLPAGGDPTNPNAIPANVELFTPSSSVKLSQSFVNNGLIDFAKRHSPKMQTSVSQIYRGQIPQPGDHLIVPSADIPDCGRINSVTLSLTRGGLTINISAEILGDGTIVGEFANIPASGSGQIVI